MTSWQEEFERVKKQYDTLPDDGTLENLSELAATKKQFILQLLKCVAVAASSKIDALMILATAANAICVQTEDPHDAIDKICEMMHIQAEICLKNEETDNDT